MAKNIVHEFRHELSPPLRASNLQQIRTFISGLMDQAAQAVQRAGYDQDDVEVERFAEMRAGGQVPSTQIAIESLADAAALFGPFLRLIRSGDNPPIDQIEVTALKVQVVWDSQALFSNFAQSGEGR